MNKKIKVLGLSAAYGLQLSVESFREIVAQTKEGIIGYLGSGLIKGIGPKTAEVIYNTFGMQTLEVLENNPEKLLQIRGISRQKLEKIQSSLLESRALRDIVSYLSPYEVSVKKAAKVLEAFRENTMRILKTQPFRLCEIKGFGFKTVDPIARATKCSLSDPLRIRGGLTYLLDEAEKEGHLYLPRAELVEKAHTLLNEGLPDDEAVDFPLVELELDQALRERSLVCDIRMVYKPDLRKAEVDVARKVLQMLSWKTGYKADIEKELALSQQKLGIVLAPKQADAVRMWYQNPLSIITGGPGTGKTTTLRVILDIYQRVKPNGEILLAAPTGRASRRMVESTGYQALTNQTCSPPLMKLTLHRLTAQVGGVEPIACLLAGELTRRGPKDCVLGNVYDWAASEEYKYAKQFAAECELLSFTLATTAKYVMALTGMSPFQRLMEKCGWSLAASADSCRGTTVRS